MRRAQRHRKHPRRPSDGLSAALASPQAERLYPLAGFRTSPVHSGRGLGGVVSWGRAIPRHSLALRYGSFFSISTLLSLSGPPDERDPRLNLHGQPKRGYQVIVLADPECAVPIVSVLIDADLVVEQLVGEGVCLGYIR